MKVNSYIFSNCFTKKFLKDCTLGQVRLVDGYGSPTERNTGIVQICNSQSSWRRVCYYGGWDSNMHGPNLVCSQLGYENYGIAS